MVDKIVLESIPDIIEFEETLSNCDIAFNIPVIRVELRKRNDKIISSKERSKAILNFKKVLFDNKIYESAIEFILTNESVEFLELFKNIKISDLFIFLKPESEKSLTQKTIKIFKIYLKKTISLSIILEDKVNKTYFVKISSLINEIYEENRNIKSIFLKSIFSPSYFYILDKDELTSEVKEYNNLCLMFCSNKRIKKLNFQKYLFSDFKILFLFSFYSFVTLANITLKHSTKTLSLLCNLSNKMKINLTLSEENKRIIIKTYLIKCSKKLLSFSLIGSNCSYTSSLLSIACSNKVTCAKNNNWMKLLTSLSKGDSTTNLKTQKMYLEGIKDYIRFKTK